MSRFQNIKSVFSGRKGGNYLLVLINTGLVSKVQLVRALVKLTNLTWILVQFGQSLFLALFQIRYFIEL